jgi:hypothetical protein
MGVAPASLHEEPEELLQEVLLPPIIPAIQAPEPILSIAHEELYAIEPELPIQEQPLS